MIVVVTSIDPLVIYTSRDYSYIKFCQDKYDDQDLKMNMTMCNNIGKPDKRDLPIDEKMMNVDFLIWGSQYFQ